MERTPPHLQTIALPDRPVGTTTCKLEVGLPLLIALGGIPPRYVATSSIREIRHRAGGTLVVTKNHHYLIDRRGNVYGPMPGEAETPARA